MPGTAVMGGNGQSLWLTAECEASCSKTRSVSGRGADPISPAASGTGAWGPGDDTDLAAGTLSSDPTPKTGMKTTGEGRSNL